MSRATPADSKIALILRKLTYILDGNITHKECTENAFSGDCIGWDIKFVISVSADVYIKMSSFFNPQLHYCFASCLV